MAVHIEYNMFCYGLPGLARSHIELSQNIRNFKENIVNFSSKGTKYN
jgi:hypothetical protein